MLVYAGMTSKRYEHVVMVQRKRKSGRKLAALSLSLLGHGDMSSEVTGCTFFSANVRSVPTTLICSCCCARSSAVFPSCD
eukprot:1188539-Prorocentrum_minimum.AAC.1